MNILYKYGYTESELIKLNKQYTIEEIDQTKDNIEILLFNMIIDAVIDGAKPQNIRVYRIIDAFSHSLGLRERKDYINFLDKDIDVDVLINAFNKYGEKDFSCENVKINSS